VHYREVPLTAEGLVDLGALEQAVRSHDREPLCFSRNARARAAMPACAQIFAAVQLGRVWWPACRLAGGVITQPEQPQSPRWSH